MNRDSCLAKALVQQNGTQQLNCRMYLLAGIIKLLNNKQDIIALFTKIARELNCVDNYSKTGGTHKIPDGKVSVQDINIWYQSRRKSCTMYKLTGSSSLHSVNAVEVGPLYMRLYTR